MKTKIILLLVITLALASCNPAKRYANFRYGGKTKQESKTQPEEDKMNSLAEIQVGEINNDTVNLPHPTIDTNLVDATEKTNLSKSEIKKNEIEKTLLVKKEITKAVEHKTHSTKKKKQVRKPDQTNHIHTPVTGTDDGDVLYVLGLILIIGAGVLALVAAGVSLLEVIYFALAMIGVAILLHFIGEAFMNIFPGMSKGKKKNRFLKNIREKFLPQNGLKYYGGMSVKEYFWIGIGVLALATIVMALIGASDIGWGIIMGLLGIHLGICVMAALIVGLMSLFPGMSIKKKVKTKK